MHGVTCIAIATRRLDELHHRHLRHASPPLTVVGHNVVRIPHLSTIHVQYFSIIIIVHQASPPSVTSHKIDKTSPSARDPSATVPPTSLSAASPPLPTPPPPDEATLQKGPPPGHRCFVHAVRDHRRSAYIHSRGLELFSLCTFLALFRWVALLLKEMIGSWDLPFEVLFGDFCYGLSPVRIWFKRVKYLGEQAITKNFVDYKPA
nr:hypothetical protein Iba_chr02eCG8340 [Ipomoea batatas]